MALRLGDKAARVLKFLLGLACDEVMVPMEHEGMRQQDVEEGWTLLRGLGVRRWGMADSPQAKNLCRLIDEWENDWFERIEGSLGRHFPAVRDAVFLNLAPGDEDAAPVTVSVLLERLNGLRDPKGPLGADGPKALAFLQDHRKLTDEVLAVPQGYLKELARFEPSQSAIRRQSDEEALGKAEADLWAWYIEWSRIARVAVKSRRALRALGYLDNRGRVIPLEEDEAPVVAPAAGTASAAGAATGTATAAGAATATATAVGPVPPPPARVAPGMPGASPFDDSRGAGT